MLIHVKYGWISRASLYPILLHAYRILRRQSYSKRKQVHDCSGSGARERLSWESIDIFYILIVIMVIQQCKFVKSHQCVHLKLYFIGNYVSIKVIKTKPPFKTSIN
jgi:hypothetical protein